MMGNGTPIKLTVWYPSAPIEYCPEQAETYQLGHPVPPTDVAPPPPAFSTGIPRPSGKPPPTCINPAPATIPVFGTSTYFR